MIAFFLALHRDIPQALTSKGSFNLRVKIGRQELTNSEFQAIWARFLTKFVSCSKIRKQG
ncbi:MAG: hypothetical protein R3D29_04995 [Nitratireductor sp.]